MTPNPVINRVSLLLRRHLRVLALGVAAAAAVSMPPFNLAGRLDARLFDLWSRVAAEQPSADIVLVAVSDPVWLTALTELASREASQLVVTTLPQPPSKRVNELVLGPTELPIGEHLLRRTDWLSGGHIRFFPDDDGLVRSLPAWLDQDPALPSLALAAARRLAAAEPAAPAAARLQLVAASAYRQLTADDLTRDPGLVADAIVVAGRPGLQLETPAGPLAAHEIVAQAIDGYRQGTLIGTSGAAALVPWAITLLAIGTLLGGHPGEAGRRGWGLALGGLGLIASSGTGFLLASLWLPVTAPAALLLTSGTLLVGQRARPRQAAPQRPASADAILAALANGEIEFAWRQIRALPAEPSTLDQLCDIAEALESARYADLAADVYHRAAQVDPRHRDAARCLVRVSQTPAEREAAEAACAEMEAPTTLSRYEILEPIGRGSTGMVHLAVDPTINRLVALKVFNLRAEYGDDALDEGLERFHREASSAGRLKHPNIVTIFDIGESHGLAFIAMEYLKGRHLSHFARPENLLPARLVLEIGATIADALDYAHSRNVIHRDIKPGNIMYDSVTGAATITDFGIARLIDVSRTRTGIVLGTPSFMAPEQLEGKNVNRYTDLFALGVSIYELLTGRLPFRGASMTKLMFVIANEPHAPVSALRPDLPASVDRLLDRALAKCPEDRFANGAEMAAALRHSASQIV